MFPSTNTTHKGRPVLWNRNLLLKHFGLARSGASYKKLERWAAKEKYFGPRLRPKDVVDETGTALLKNLLNYEIWNIQAKRGKWLAVQLWVGKTKKPKIIANDGRGSRFWYLLEDATRIDEHLNIFIDLLESHRSQPSLLILHGPLAHHRHNIRPREGITLSRMAYKERYTYSISKSFSHSRPSNPSSHLNLLEAGSIRVLRETVAEAKKPVLLHSMGKTSSVLLHLARKAFWPGNLPFPLLHIDTGWKFQAMYSFRDQLAKTRDTGLIVYKNPDGSKQGINPIEHSSFLHKKIMKTQSLKQALEKYQFDALLSGIHLDEAKKQPNEREHSFPTQTDGSGLKRQCPAPWNIFSARTNPGEALGVFPLSNWTELDIWTYIQHEKISIVPLYFSAERPVIERCGKIIVVDDDRLPITNKAKIKLLNIRFRTLGCYPLTGATESHADTVDDIILELLTVNRSKRKGNTNKKNPNPLAQKKKKADYL